MKQRLIFPKLGFLVLVSALFTSCAVTSITAAPLSPAQIDRVGQRIWQNECAGTVAGLTSWNSGEDFASLGIGHFIWYSKGKRGPFEESFPPLMAFLNARGIPTPAWTQGPSPWPTKAAFDADKKAPRQQELRGLLSRTVRQQTEFIMLRLEQALPKMLAAAPAKSRGPVQAVFQSLMATPEGAFCLIDYVNFKGEGTSPTERYQGQGWGLLQVLQEMSAAGGTSNMQFAAAAKRVLSRRVANAPAERKEQRWLAGWHNRCDGYARKL